jgi:pSer/pThr/pTyr-binding forkhead associated (FHA) protein
MDEAWKGNSNTASTKLDGAKNAANRLLNLAQRERKSEERRHLFSLVRFSTTGAVEAPLTEDLAQVGNRVDQLKTDSITNLGAGLELGLQQVEQASSSTPRLVILLTDGNTNTGRTQLQILNELGSRARQEQICIYTVGIGDPGNLDEMFLKQLGAASSCGGYFYANDAPQLENIYIRLRHQATGQEVQNFDGKIKQNETIAEAARYDVKAGQDQLYVTLNWKGSMLDLDLRDPSGQKVTASYPGAKIDDTSHPIYVMVRNPMVGTWSVGIFGRDVPEGILDYSLVMSRQPAPIAAANPPTNNQEFPWWIVIAAVSGLLLLIGIIILVVVLAKKSATPRASRNRVSSGPYLIIQTGNQAGQRIPIRGRMLSLGRAALPGQLALNDLKISKVHARLHHAEGRYYLEDAVSANGTYLNGMNIERQVQPLSNGDAIQLGNTTLIYVDSSQPRIHVRGYLRVSGGTTFPLYEGANSLGREARCRVRLNDPKVSGFHASIVIQGSQATLIDQGSHNGTFKNNKKLLPNTSVALNQGDQITLGSLNLQFSLVNAEENLRARK